MPEKIPNSPRKLFFRSLATSGFSKLTNANLFAASLGFEM